MNNQVTFTDIPTFTYHTDPGHGWIEVPKDLATALGFVKDISSYSYHDQDNYYLEEDGDAGLLFDALTNRGQEYKTLNQNVGQGDSFVRSLASVGR